MPLVTMNSDLAAGAGENNSQIGGRHGGTVANASSIPGTPGGPGTPQHQDGHSTFDNINTPFTTEFPNPDGAYNPTLEIDGTMSSIGLPNSPFEFSSISVLASRYKGVQSAGETNLYPMQFYFQPIDFLGNHDPDVFTITNPLESTYNYPTQYTFSNTPKVQDGVYTSQYQGTSVTPEGNYGSSILLTGGTRLKVPEIVQAVNSQFGISVDEKSFLNTPVVSNGNYTAHNHPSDVDSDIPRDGEFGSSTLLNKGINTKYPNTIRNEEFDNKVYSVKTGDKKSPLNEKDINKQYTDADGYYSNRGNFKKPSQIREDSNRGPGAGGGLGNPDIMNEPYLIFNPTEQNSRGNNPNNRMLPIESTLDDVTRIAKFAVSSRGGWFLAKQLMLQVQNAREETRLFNPVKFYASVLPFVHMQRHGAGIGEKYEYTGTAGSPGADPLSGRYLPLAEITTEDSVYGSGAVGRVNYLRKTVFPGAIPGEKSLLFGIYWDNLDLNPVDNVAMESSTGATTIEFTGVPPTVFDQRTGGRLKLLRWRSVRSAPQRAVNSQRNLNQTSIERIPAKLHGNGTDNYVLPSYEDIMKAAYESRTGLEGNYEKNGDMRNTYNRNSSDSVAGLENIQMGEADTGKGLGTTQYDKKKSLYSGPINRNTVGDTPLSETRNPQVKHIWFSKTSNVNRVGVSVGNDVEHKDFNSMQDKRGQMVSDRNYDMVPVKFFFKSTQPELAGGVTNKIIAFRAYVSNITDTFTPDWNNEQFIGRPDKVYTYKGAGRKIGFDIQMHPNSRVELIPQYEKLNQLAALCYPDFEGVYDDESLVGQRMVAPFCKLTIGDLYKDVWGFVDGCSITFDDKGTWEIDPGARVPRLVKATIGFTWIGNQLPSINSNFYDILNNDNNDFKPAYGNEFSDGYFPKNEGGETTAESTDGGNPQGGGE